MSLPVTAHRSGSDAGLSSGPAPTAHTKTFPTRSKLSFGDRKSQFATRLRGGWANPDLWRPLVIILGVSMTLAGIGLHLLVTRVMIWAHYNDFGKFYYSAAAAASGLPMYGPSPATSILIFKNVRMQFWNMNPPHFEALILPLTWLPIGRAYAVWVVANFAAAIAALHGISTALNKRPSLWWVIPMLFAAPTLTTTATGQMTGLLLGLVTWIWLDIRAERWTRAGVLIGVVCSLKPFLVPLALYLLLRRKWRAAAASIATAVACFALGLLIFGLAAHVDWIDSLRGVTWAWVPMNGSIYAPLARLSARGDLIAKMPPTASGRLTIMGHMIAAAILLIGLYFCKRDSNEDRSILIVLATCLLASPLGWVYYVWILAAPAWTCWTDPVIRRATLIAALGWLVPFFSLWHFNSLLFVLTVGSAYTWSLMVLWLGAITSSVTALQRSGRMLDPSVRL